MISIGGFFGGAAVSWIMPLLFNFLAEYLLAFVVICCANGQRTRQFQKYRIVVFVIMASLMIYFYPLIIERVTVLSISGLMVWGMILFQVMQYQRYGIVILLFSLICMMTFFEESWSDRKIIFKDRNYYGVHSVYHKNAARKYMHGTTVHGLQPLSHKYKTMPTSYYGFKSPVGRLLTTKEFKFSNVALLGLGVGTLTTYFYAGQTIDIFELDKLVINMAKEYFTYLNHTRGKVKIYVGDARLELERQGRKKYDLIIVDVFTGDAVPEHLMTQEAFELYRDRLTDEGIVLIHASNRYLDLGTPLLGTSHSVGAYTGYQQSGARNFYTTSSVWVAISWNKEIFDKLVEKEGWSLPKEDSYKRAIVWSDKHSSIFSIIKKTGFKNRFMNWKIPWY